MIPSSNPKDNGQDRAIPAAPATQDQLLELFLNIPGLFLQSSGLVIPIAANTRAGQHFPENTGHRKISSPNELLLHFSFPEERLESPKKALKCELKPFIQPSSPRGRAGCCGQEMGRQNFCLSAARAHGQNFCHHINISYFTRIKNQDGKTSPWIFRSLFFYSLPDRSSREALSHPHTRAFHYYSY